MKKTSDEYIIEATVTLDLDGKWAKNVARLELTDYSKVRLDDAFAVRGHVRKFMAHPRERRI